MRIISRVYNVSSGWLSRLGLPRSPPLRWRPRQEDEPDVVGGLPVDAGVPVVDGLLVADVLVGGLHAHPLAGVVHGRDPVRAGGGAHGRVHGRGAGVLGGVHGRLHAHADGVLHGAAATCQRQRLSAIFHSFVV